MYRKRKIGRSNNWQLICMHCYRFSLSVDAKILTEACVFEKPRFLLLWSVYWNLIIQKYTFNIYWNFNIFCLQLLCNYWNFVTLFVILYNVLFNTVEFRMLYEVFLSTFINTFTCQFWHCYPEYNLFCIHFI